MTATLDRRPLGGTSMSVSALAMGCSKLGAFWQGRSPSAAEEALAAARDRGIDFFDTADCYARGLSERIIGRAFRRERDRVVICTKVGLLKTPLAIASASRRSRPGDQPRNPGHGVAQRAMTSLRGLAPNGEASTCFSPSYLTKALERSLRRLRSDHVDLLLLHGPSLEVIQKGGFLPALEDARRSGKAAHVGISCTTEAEARAALEVPGVECIQIPHNLCRPQVVPAIVPRAGELGIAVVAIAPFGSGELLRTDPEATTASSDLERGCLAFALGTPGVAAVVVGMSSPGHVTVNVTAATSGPVSEEVLSQIRDSSCGDGA